METTIKMKRKSIDLPVEVIDKLTVLAVRSGHTLKEYMEGVLSKTASEDSISPSGDEWFDDEDNLKIVKEGIRQIESGECKTYSAGELRARLGV